MFAVLFRNSRLKSANAGDFNSTQNKTAHTLLHSSFLLLLLHLINLVKLLNANLFKLVKTWQMNTDWILKTLKNYRLWLTKFWTRSKKKRDFWSFWDWRQFLNIWLKATTSRCLTGAFQKLEKCSCLNACWGPVLKRDTYVEISLKLWHQKLQCY